MGVAQKELDAAQAELDEKEAEAAEVQAKFDAAMAEKERFKILFNNINHSQKVDFVKIQNLIKILTLKQASA